MHTLPLYGYFNITSLILLVMGIVIAGLAQARVRNAYAYYSRVPSARGYNASAVIRSILGQNGAGDVAVEAGQGTLTDNYNPRTKVIRLSPDVYGSSPPSLRWPSPRTRRGTLSSTGRGTSFCPFAIFLAPVVTVVSHLAVPVIILGFIMSYPPLVDIGIYLFARRAAVPAHHAACGVRRQPPGDARTAGYRRHHGGGDGRRQKDAGFRRAHVCGRHPGHAVKSAAPGAA